MIVSHTTWSNASFWMFLFLWSIYIPVSVSITSVEQWLSNMMKLKANAPHKPWHYYYRKKGLQRAMVGYPLLMPCFIVWMLVAECSESISHSHPAHKQEMSKLHNGERAKGPSLLNLFIHHQHSHRHMTFSITISTQSPSASSLPVTGGSPF